MSAVLLRGQRLPLRGCNVRRAAPALKEPFVEAVLHELTNGASVLREASRELSACRKRMLSLLKAQLRGQLKAHKNQRVPCGASGLVRARLAREPLNAEQLDVLAREALVAYIQELNANLSLPSLV